MEKSRDNATEFQAKAADFQQHVIPQKRGDRHAETKNHDLDLIIAGVTFWIVRHVAAEVSSSQLTLSSVPRCPSHALVLAQPAQLDLQLHDLLVFPHFHSFQLLLPLHETLDSLKRLLVLTFQLLQLVTHRLGVFLHVAQLQHQLLPRFLLTFQFVVFFFQFLKVKKQIKIPLTGLTRFVGD